MKKICLIFLLALAGCIGQDILDDAAVEPQLAISPETGAIRLGETLSFSYAYTDQFGQPADANVTWATSDPAIIDIDQTGLATAIASGQVNISAAAGNAQSNQVRVTSVDDDNSVASVEIVGGSNVIPIGGTAVYTARALNINGSEVTGVDFSWSSDNTSVASVDMTGEVQGLAPGTASITAIAEGVSSSPRQIMIGSSERTGTFESQSGYVAKGTAILEVNDVNELTLTLSEDFETSFALGTFIYLANSTNGSSVRS
ncbi:MAG: Ig-like domain-containing protein, partial [Cyclobacteriaceae bacterium]